MLTEETKVDLSCLEGRRNILLLEKEETWRLKRKVTWLECGDDNTNFFHPYAKGMKDVNTIWSLTDMIGIKWISFEEMEKVGFDHFKALFIAPLHAFIAKAISVAQLFSRFVEEEDNRVMM